MTGAAIVGVGLTPFGRFQDRTLSQLAGEAIAGALEDAGVEQHEVDMAFVANSMASVTTGQVAVVGQAVLRPLGYSSIPVYNIDNACAGSSSALHLAVHAIESGRAEVILVVGVEKLFGAEKSDSFRALNGAVDTDYLKSAGIDAGSQSVFIASIYPKRLARYQGRYGLEARTLAEIAVKNRHNAALNPGAQYKTPISIDEVLAARVVVAPLTVLMCAPISDGASAVVVTSEKLARSRASRPVWIRGIAVGMGAPPGHESVITSTARRAFGEARIEPADIDVAEVHDSIAFNELRPTRSWVCARPVRGRGSVQAGPVACPAGFRSTPVGVSNPGAIRSRRPAWPRSSSWFSRFATTRASGRFRTSGSRSRRTPADSRSTTPRPRPSPSSVPIRSESPHERRLSAPGRASARVAG